MFIIRHFQPQDFETIIYIEAKVFKEHDPYLYMDLYESISDGFFVAENNGEIAGYIVGFISIPGKGRIFTLAVLEKYRGLGIGTELMDRLLWYFGKKKVREVSLEVRMGNISAQHFYLNRGFLPAWVEKGYYSDGEDAIVMKKKLDY